MNKKKLTKATSGLLLTALMVGGAAAFLSTSQTGTKSNSIKIGQITVVFDNQQDVIALTDMYPMTRAYAEGNLTPYTFTVDNDGDVDVLYSLRAVTEEGFEIDPSLINLILDDGDVVKLSESNLLKDKELNHKMSDNHKLLAYIDESATIDDTVGKAISFHLELSAVQDYGAAAVTPVKEPSAVFYTDETHTATVTYSWEELKTKYPDAVSDTEIGASAFWQNKLIKEIVIPDGVTTIAGNAFNGCTNLTSVVLPSTLQTIGNQAFYGCTSLAEIDIPEGVTSIGDSAFDGCSALASVTLPSALEVIGTRTFAYCTALTEVNIPEGVKEIGSSAFEGCSNLAKLTLPSTLENMKSVAFFACSSLTDISYNGTVSQWGAVTKTSDWARAVPVSGINCSDGTASKY